MDTVQFELLFLIIIRITSFMMVSPIFSLAGIPMYAKMGLSLMLSMLVFAIIPTQELVQNTHILGFAILVANEVIFGLTIGFITNLFFSAIQMGGQFIDFQMGLSMASVYDPATASVSTIFGRMYNWIALMLLFILNIHHYLLNAIANSFSIIPIGAIGITDYNMIDIVRMFSGSFVVALQVSIPIVMILFFTDVIMGIISRTVPQLNVFILGMPLKILFGLLAFSVLVPAIIYLIISVVEGMPEVVEKAFQMFLPNI